MMVISLQSSASSSTPTLISSSTPIIHRRLKRRSKSLDAITIKRKSHLWHYNDNSTPPTSPVISFGLNASSETMTTTATATTTERTLLCNNNDNNNNKRNNRRRRRHSSNSVVEPNTNECLRLANIYGWVTANNSSHDTRIKQGTSSLSLSRNINSCDDIYEEVEKENFPLINNNNYDDDLVSNYNNVLDEKTHYEEQERQRQQLHASHSFTQGTTNKISKMFTRRRKSLHSTSTPASPITPTPSIDFKHHCEQAKGIVSAIIAAASSEELGWVGVEDKNQHYSDEEFDGEALKQSEEAPPSPPIENDPHVFDLLEHNSTTRFITFSKRDEKLSSATVEKLVAKLTKEMDSEFLMDFFLTYRQFLSPIRLCKLLILRFRWALMEDTDERRLVRIRTFVVIRHWLTHYWAYDFVPSRTLRFMLCTFLSQLRNHSIILSSPRDARIIKSLRNVLKRQRKLYSMKEDENGSIRSSVDTFSSSKTRRMAYYGTTGSTPTSTFPTTRSGGSRKDSAIGMTSTGLSPALKEIKSSISTPIFFSRSRRVSSTTITRAGSSDHNTSPLLYHSYNHHSGQRRHHTSSMNGSSWSAKMNFGIRSIKRTVPSVCQSLWHTVHNNTCSTSAPGQSGCACPIKIPEHKRTTSLIRSASRLFDHHYNNGQHQPQASISTPIPKQQEKVPFLASSSRATNKDPKHPNPLCPLHTIPMTPTPSQQHTLKPKHSSTTPTMDSTEYKPFILGYRSEIIAQQFYIIEQKMLQNVTWDELAELRWKNNNNNSSGRRASTIVVAEQGELGGGGIEQLINYFNMTCQWVASEIVQSRSLETRVRVIEKYIRIALKCYHHHNYSTLMQILLGLQSPAVSRLEKTWQRIDQYECQIFHELKEMAKPFRNWKNVRMAMNKAIENVAESSAVESILTSSRTDPLTTTIANISGSQITSTASQTHASSGDISGCIPFLGLYLSDLVFNAELPTFIAGPSSNIKEDENTHQGDNSKKKNGDAELRSRLSTHLVNYNKCRITASVIKHVLAFQVLSRTYEFNFYPELFSRLRKLDFLDNIEIRKASLLCEESRTSQASAK